LRFEAAYALWAKVNPKSTQADFAKAVSSRAGRSFTANSVLGWLRGAVPRELETMVALATIVGVPAGWLFFGEERDHPMVDAVDTMRRALNYGAHGDRVSQAQSELDALTYYFRAQPKKKTGKGVGVSETPEDHVAPTTELHPAVKSSKKSAG
jgi:transcriptional regulator with XRE-family HTH domain